MQSRARRGRAACEHDPSLADRGAPAANRQGGVPPGMPTPLSDTGARHCGDRRGAWESYAAMPEQPIRRRRPRPDARGARVRSWPSSRCSPSGSTGRSSTRTTGRPPAASCSSRRSIRDQVAGFLVDELYANVDVEAEIREALPPRAQPLAGPAAGALRTFAERAARELLARPRAQLAWEDANRNAHKLLLRVLEGGGPVVSTNGGVVVLDLKSLLEETQARVGIGGRVAARLPDDAAEITILRSDQLAAAQDAFKILRPLPIVLVSLSLLLFAIALIISPGWRRKAVRAYGIGFIAAGALGLAAIVDPRRHGGRLARAAPRPPSPRSRQTWTVGDVAARTRSPCPRSATAS